MHKGSNNSSMSEFFDTCYADMHRGDVIVAFKGTVDSDVIADTLGLVETKLDNQMEPSVLRKKLYNVLVECLQNLFHHVESIPIENTNQVERLGAFALVKQANGYRFTTGNMVMTEHSQNLKTRIDKINGLSKQELKDYYKSVLNNQTFSAKGGGGLGLIDIARKTGNPIEYKFVPFDENYQFFNMDVLINS